MIELGILRRMHEATATGNAVQKDSATRMLWNLMEEQEIHAFQDAPLGAVYQRELERLRRELGLNTIEKVNEVGATLHDSIPLDSLYNWTPSPRSGYNAPEAWIKKMKSLEPSERREVTFSIGRMAREFRKVSVFPTVGVVRERLHELRDKGAQISEMVALRGHGYFRKKHGPTPSSKA
jgi:hypothetical protein